MHVLGGRYLLRALHRRCRRPCDHAETWFAVQDNFVYMPVVSNDLCLGLPVQITVEVPPLHVEVCWRSSSTVVDVPVLMQRRGLQFLDNVFGMSVVSNNRCLGLTVQRTVESTVALLTMWSMSPVCAGRRFGLLLEVPQTQFIARVGRHSSAHRDGRLSPMVWRRCWLGIFRAPPGCPGVECQFFGALDDEEVFVVEGSCTISP